MDEAFKVNSVNMTFAHFKKCLWNERSCNYALTQSRGAHHTLGFAFSHLSNDLLERWIYQTGMQQRTLILPRGWSPPFFLLSFFFLLLACHLKCTMHVFLRTICARYIILY